jgi:hypothetical protein
LEHGGMIAMTNTKLLRHWPLVAPLVALVVLGGAGCGGGSQGASGAKAASATSMGASAQGASPARSKVMVPSNFCSLLSASDISQVVGQSMPAPQMSSSGGGEIDCDSNAPGTNVGLVSYSIFVDHLCFKGEAPSADCLSDTSQTFAVDKQEDQKHGPLQPISGLGEQAYCATKNNGVTQGAVVNVLQGWLHISVFSDTCAHSQTLASMLLPRI